MGAEEVLVPITLFMSTAVVFVIWLITRHRERVSMIEKGLSSEEIKAMYQRGIKDVKRDPLSSLKWGLLFLLAGVAILLGNYLHVQFNVDEGAIFGLVCLFVGIGLVVFYSIASKKLSQ